MIIYNSVTEEPLHLTPSQEPSQGSPPLGFQPLSLDGEFKLVNITFNPETAKTFLINFTISLFDQLITFQNCSFN